MKIILTGSLGNIGKPLTETLLASGHHVVVISSSEDRAPEIEALGAEAAIGSVEDVAFLTRIFEGADAVYTMVPPNFAASDWKSYIAGIGQNYASGIKAAGVKKVVNLSSTGADQPAGMGPVSGLFYVEKALNELSDVDVLHLRPSYFYTNFYGNVDMIKNAGIIGSNCGAEVKQALVHPHDIALVAAAVLSDLNFEGKTVRYIVGDVRTGTEIASVFGNAIGKPELQWVSFDDEQTEQALIQAGLPKEIASNYVEMGAAIRDGRMLKHYFEVGDTRLQNLRLEDFAKEFAKAF